MKIAHVILGFACFLSVAISAGDKGALKEKLQASIVKDLEFEELPVADAFKRISEISRRFSKDKRKVNIYLIASDDVKKKRITLSMKDSSLYDIIKYAALLSGLKMKVEKYAVVLKAGKK